MIVIKRAFAMLLRKEVEFAVESAKRLPSSTANNNKNNNNNTANSTNTTYPQYIREPEAVTKAFMAALTRHGIRRDAVLARVIARLRLKYGHPTPLDLAVDALRPSLRYVRPKDAKNNKYYVPIAVWPQSGVGLAVRWMVKAAVSRKYKGQRPDLERGLWDELDAVLSGTSSLFAKKAALHRNPN